MKNISFLIATAILLASCSSTSKMSQTLTSLSANNWQLSSLGQSMANVKEGMTLPTLSFNPTEMKVSGNAGCNTFTGTFKNEKDKLSFGDVATTKKMCPDMTMEDGFLNALQKADNFSMYEGKLVLKDAEGTQLMSLDPVPKI